MGKRGVDNNDLLALAKSGRVLNEPETHIKTGELNYRIESPDQKLKAVFSLLGEKKVCIITVMKDE